jgi:acyl-[acyl-carrier-protein]-phospholipid O-acyltransferase/long-chain-fatty-acid--[acyl-carrier-protein] ligase
VAFNKNATKLILIGFVQRLLPASQAGRRVNAISLLLVAPFVFFAPLTGWLADRHARRYVVSATLLVAGCRDDRALRRGVPALPASRRRWLFLLGLQLAIMSPARRGFAKEVAGENVGWMAQFKTSTPLAIGAEAFPIDRIAADPALQVRSTFRPTVLKR